MKKLIYAALALGTVISPLSAEAIKKQPLKVLYVGGSTDFGEVKPEQKDSLVNLRTESFRKMLSEYFTSVSVVPGSKYVTEMSRDFDVTILDGLPKELTPRIMEKDAAGNTTRFEAATYIPADFDCPMITIGRIGENVRSGTGVKSDWYCLCLDADAHSWKTDHEIFKGPFKVNLKVSIKPTPEDAFHYTYFYDSPLTDSIPMWSVQTEGYKTNHDLAIGMVSRPWGYADSPDTEFISSGVCAKTIDAVAIGRHGNFLHWGFAASPAYMTQNGKDVFANAVAYISKFKGQKPIARKFKDRRATREYIKEIKYLSTREYYESRMVSDSLFQVRSKKQYEKALAKQQKGEELTNDEKRTLSYGAVEDFKRGSYEDHLKRRMKEFYNLFGNDEKAYARYFDENYDYFYGEDGFYVIYVDEDAKAWGIPNNDVRLLDKAISSLENGVETERAARVLARYTMADFQTPAEWRDWFDTYRDRMFFTETGGWKFMINGDENIPGNNYFKYFERVKQSKTTSTGTSTSDRNPVMVSVDIRSDVYGKKSLVVKFNIHPGYHIYANVADVDAFLPTKLDLRLPEGVEAGEWTSSRPTPLGTSGTMTFENSAEYTCPLSGNGAGPLYCTVSYQCCDDHVCMPPVKKELKVVY